MTTEQYVSTGHEMLEVPVDTFRDFVKFIAKHDLWDEVRQALTEAGIDTVPINRRPVQIISELVTGKGGNQSEDPDHADALVTPECGCNVVFTHPDLHPHTPSPTHPDGGTGDGGIGDGGTVDGGTHH